MTRSELVISLAIGTFAVGLTVPAIAKTRAVSNKEACANNFRQIGKACLSYGSDHEDRLPAASGVLVPLLPYLEEHKIGEDLAASGKTWSDPVNAKIVATRLKVAQCPDTPNADRLLSGEIDGNEFKAAPTDYTGVTTITGAIRDIFPRDYDMSTALQNGGTFAQITDGKSTSVMGIVEIADKPNSWQAGKLQKTANPLAAGRGSGSWVANGINAPRGYSWDGKSVPGPCGMNCSNGAAIYSFHADGCNFLFADGSVRFLKKETDVWVVYAILTRRGGETLSPGDL